MCHLILLYVEQVLSKESEIDGKENVCSSPEVYIKALERIEVHKRLEAWEVSEELPPLKTFPTHFLYHISTSLGDEELFQRIGIFQKTSRAEKDGRD